MQVFATICLSCARELTSWDQSTFKETVLWGEYIENLIDDMTTEDKVLAQQYLDNPLQFANTGFDTHPLSVVEAKLSVKILASASHYLSRQLICNVHFSANLPLVKAVLNSYLDAEEEDKPDAMKVWVKDLMKETTMQVKSRLAAEWLQNYGQMLRYEKLTLSPSSIYDQEIRFFLQPEKVKAFGLSRALAKKMISLTVVEQCIKLCRKHPSLLEVLLLALIPRPLILSSKFSPVHDQCKPLVRDMVLNQVLKNQYWLNVWKLLDPYLLFQVAAMSQEFEREMEKNELRRVEN
jgi:hypothetical protein